MEAQNCYKEVQLYNGAGSDRGKSTYGELIDLFDEALDSDDLCAKFKSRYPEIKIGRRFYDTVSRIASPTKPSLTGKCSITGTQLATYRRRTWEPRIRNDSGKSRMYVLPVVNSSIVDGEITFPLNCKIMN